MWGLKNEVGRQAITEQVTCRQKPKTCKGVAHADIQIPANECTGPAGELGHCVGEIAK